jgi:hypothetical protein
MKEVTGLMNQPSAARLHSLHGTLNAKSASSPKILLRYQVEVVVMGPFLPNIEVFS